jgi:hypothetical protein
MKLRHALALLCLVLVTAAAAQQTGRRTRQKAQPEMPPEMKEYIEKYATPGEHQKHLEMLAGQWTTKQRFWPAPGAPVMEAKGTANHRMVLGGRFLATTYRGSFMGMPFQGMGTAGYDRYRNKYVETWIDNFGTMTLISEGTCDGTGKVRTIEGKFDDAMTGKPSYMRSVYRFQDKDHYTLEMFGPAPDGQEYQWMVIEHTRRTPPAAAGASSEPKKQ